MSQVDFDPVMAAIAYASACGLKDEIRSAAITQIAELESQLRRISAELKELKEKEAWNERSLRNFSHPNEYE